MKVPLASRFAAKLMCIPANTAQDNYKWVTSGGFQTGVVSAEMQINDEHQKALKEQHGPLRVVVRRVLMNGALNRPYDYISADMMNMLHSIQDMVSDRITIPAMAVPTKYCAPYICPILEFWVDIVR